MTTDINPEQLKEKILELTRQYSKAMHRSSRPGCDSDRSEFVPGETVIPYAGRVFTEDEVESAVSSTLDFWLTLGPEGEKFETALRKYLGVRNCLLTNSGSSANLLAVSALTSHKLPKEQRICPGDEVITAAAGFPTTVAPIIQCGAVPVFIDADPITGNPRCEQLEDVYVPGKTKAVIMAHALGNPFDVKTTVDFCKSKGIWLIEDNCDALGATYQLPDQDQPQLTGTFGDLSTQSFYPPHHLTLGEGGSINIVKQAALKVLVESFRDWGRDCWCPSGKDDTCNKRFNWKLGELPEGYDHKYIYTHMGYNLKPLDIQAAIGVEQLKKLPDFIEARQKNWQILRSGLAEFEDVFSFSLPTHATHWNEDGSFGWDDTGCQSSCSWFGFMLRVKPDALFTRSDFANHLTNSKIGNRMFFGGNLLRQPAFVEMARNSPSSMKTASNYPGADAIMNEAIFIGTYPGLSEEMLEYIVNSIASFVRSR